MSQRFKAAIQEALRRKGWSQNYLAERVMGIHPTALSQWWKTGKVSRENMRRLSEELDIPLSALYAALDDDDEDGDSRDELAEAFTRFVSNLPDEDREAVTALLTVASRKMASQFLLDKESSTRKDSPAHPTRGPKNGAVGPGDDEGRDKSVSRVRGKK